jgi:Ca2+-binding RTX toxin-like protein
MLRRAITLAVVMGLVLTLGAGAALAATIQCTGGFCEGTPEDDIIFGTDGQDQIFGLAGDDEIYGLRNSDTLVGGRGDDYLEGGPGHDVLRGKQGNDTLVGGPDTTKGPRRTDEYFCGGGVDTVILEKGEDSTHEMALTCENIVRNK